MMVALVSVSPKPTEYANRRGGEVVQEFVGATRGIGAYQHTFTWTRTGDRGQLREGWPGDRDVIGGGVGSGITWSQRNRQRFTGPAADILDKRTQRAKSEAPLIGSWPVASPSAR